MFFKILCQPAGYGYKQNTSEEIHRGLDRTSWVDFLFAYIHSLTSKTNGNDETTEQEPG